LLLPVTNLGVPGYGTDQSYLVLRRAVADGRPRVVVYTFCGNDPGEVANGSRYGRAKPLARLEGGALRFSLASDRSLWLERHSLSFRTVEGMIQRWRESRIASSRPTSDAMTQELLVRLVSAMADSAHAVGSRFVISGQLPEWLDVLPASRRPGDLRLDLSTVFTTAEAQGDTLVFRDGHWNERAHSLAAAAVATALGNPQR
jgi:hypothetical protein